MNRSEALADLGNGHQVWRKDHADTICEAFGVKKAVTRKFYSDPPGTFKGLTMAEGQEGSKGIDAVSLAHHVAKQLGVTDFPSMFGRGSQARVIAAAVERQLNGQPRRSDWDGAGR